MAPTRCVPKRWMAKSATSVATDNQGMYGDHLCVTTSSPSHADMIESEGVMTPSPRIIPDPSTASTTITNMPRALKSLAALSFRSARIENMPPSPWLSARMMSITYLSETTTPIAQKKSDVQPKTSSWP